MSEQCFTIVLSTKPLLKLTGTGGQVDRRTDRKDHVLNQADAMTKNDFFGTPCM